MAPTSQETRSELVVHPCPDPDALLSVVIIRLFGKAAFPGFFPDGILTKVLPEVRFVGAGFPVEPQEHSIVLDTGGVYDNRTFFDHHGLPNKCALDLIAARCGVNSTNLHTVFRRVRENDLNAWDLFGTDPNQSNKDHIVRMPQLSLHQAVGFAKLLKGFYAMDEKLRRRTGQFSPAASFWQMVQAGECLISCAFHFSDFQAEGQWQRDLLKAYIAFLWESQAELVQGVPEPETLAEAVRILNEGWEKAKEEADDYSWEDDAKKGNVFRFMSLPCDQWFRSDDGKWLPWSAIFSICGIAHGLLSLRLNEVDRLTWLKLFFHKLTAMDLDWRSAQADFDNNSLVFKTGQKIIAAMNSDAQQVSPYSRYRNSDKKIRADVAIAFRSLPMTQITVAHESLQSVLLQLGYTLRWAELLNQGSVAVDQNGQIEESEYKRLNKIVLMPGMSQLVPAWFISAKPEDTTRSSLVSNRTMKNYEVPQTTLTKSTIVRLTREVFLRRDGLLISQIVQILAKGQTEKEWPEDVEYRDLRDGRKIQVA